MTLSLAAKSLTLSRGGATLLADVSIDFSSRGAIAVIGPNGAGKSMLMKLLAGLEQRSAGEIVLDGRSLATYSRAALAQRIGYIPQHFQPHWDLTVADLVRLGVERAGRGAPDTAGRAMAEFELTGFERRRWSTLSGGERGRVLLAMVLAVDPPILLADEPAASLDIKHRIEVARALASRGKERLSIVIMHDIELAFRLFERVIVIERGRVAMDGLTRAVIDDPRLDAVFGVRFARVAAAEGTVLQAFSP